MGSTTTTAHCDANTAKQCDNLLVSAVKRLPIPTSKPSQPPGDRGAELGLNLLRLALGLEHVEHLSESLVLTDSTHLSRSVNVNIDLKVVAIDPKVNNDLELISPTRTPAPRPVPPDTESKNGHSTHIWLPIARYARDDLTPIMVRDGANEVLPCITNVKIAEVFTQGLISEFRKSLPRDQDQDFFDPPRLPPASRWLIESAIAKLVEGDMNLHTHPDATKGDTGDPVRTAAANAIEQLFPEGSQFLQYLDIASSEYVLIVEMARTESHVSIHYDTPVMPAKAQSRHRKALALLLPTNQLTVEYQTSIPASTTSYDVTVSVPGEILIRRFFMTTDLDEPSVQSLVAEIEEVADSYADEQKVSHNYEQARRIVSKLDELRRRRADDLHSFKSYITKTVHRHSILSEFHLPLPSRMKLTAGHEAMGKFSSKHRIVSRLERFSDSYKAHGSRQLPVPDGSRGSAALKQLAELLKKSELGTDISVGNDPREHGGHVYWRRRQFPGAAESVKPVTVRVYLALADDPPSLASSVTRLLIAVFGLVFTVGIILVPDLLLEMHDITRRSSTLVPPGYNSSKLLESSDAIVTVLLLVPGLLLARLDLPSRRTVLGQLRLFPKYVASLAVIFSSLLAVVAATSTFTYFISSLKISLWALAALLVAMMVDGLGKMIRRRNRVPNRRSTPLWLLSEVRSIQRFHLPRRTSLVQFSTERPQGDRPHSSLMSLLERLRRPRR